MDIKLVDIIDIIGFTKDEFEKLNYISFSK